MSTSVTDAATTSLTCSCTIDGATMLPITQSAERLQLAFTASPGLYQFSIVVDATDFDWDELYVNLELFHNKGQRTGPWDFDILHNNAPLVPSYWVSLDGRKIGLWYCQRVTLEDMAEKRFRGNMAFYIGEAGEHELTFDPYRAIPIRWLSATLGPDPEDTLDPRTFDLTGWEERAPAARWADPAYWADLREKLATTHALYRDPLRRTFEWIRRKGGEHYAAPPTTWNMDRTRGNYHPEDILPLLAMHYLEGEKEAIPLALHIVDEAIAAPHWGNPNEDGYGCDGDMGAAKMLRALSWAYHALRDYLGDERRERLVKKLRLQGQRFFNLVLLHRDYWGGSVIQDHGKISLAAFAAGIPHLLGVLPEAHLWTAYAIRRVGRNLRALPLDGAIPASSYYNHYLYLDEPTFYRETLLALTGEDLFDQGPFREVIDYTINVLREQDHNMLVGPLGKIDFIGANAFFNRMATKYADGKAAYLQQRLLETPEIAFFHTTQEQAYYHGALRGFFTYDPSVPPVDRRPAIKPLQFYEDSGLAHYRDPQDDVTLSVRSGPWCGYNAYRHVTCPCDRMESLQGVGHFMVAVGNTPLLVSPDAGYRLKWDTRSVLLIDGEGPHGDTGYPMSIPAFPDLGDEIQFTRWDEQAKTGWIRLNLAPAYPEAMGMAVYTRDFLIEPGRIILRDQVVLSRPHSLQWRFQGAEENGVTLETPLTCRFGSLPAVRVEARPAGVELQTTIAPTEVIYAYSSSFKTFLHAAYTSAAPAAAATVDYVITWRKNGD
ncbi:MAG TPA: hypothetical protein VGM23_07735 [Armatimonadota bacterium]